MAMRISLSADAMISSIPLRHDDDRAEGMQYAFDEARLVAGFDELAHGLR